MRSIFFLLICLIGFTSFGVTTVSFEGDFLSDWNLTSQWKTGYYINNDYLCSNIATAPAGTQGFVKSIQPLLSVDKGNQPKTDSIAFSVVLSNIKPRDVNRLDVFQIVVSTNKWIDMIVVEDHLKYYDENISSSWITNNVTVHIPNLSSCEEVYIGLKTTAIGVSRNYTYFKSLSLDSLAQVECLSSKTVEQPMIGDTNVVIEVAIRKDPVENVISNLTVWSEIIRNDIVYTNQLYEIVQGSGVYTNDILQIDGDCNKRLPLDAGTLLQVNIFAIYESAINALGSTNVCIGKYVQKHENIFNYELPQLGSVWINEFSPDQVEICGTVNRDYLSGWTLELIDANTNLIANKVFTEPFDFSSQYRINPNLGLGLIVFPLDWSNISCGEYFLRLRNASHVIEHETVGFDFSFSSNTSLSMTGLASWHELGAAYDWSGWASSMDFLLTKTNSTPGSVNDGQFFEVSSEGWFRIKSESLIGGVRALLPYVSINYTIDWSSGSFADLDVTDTKGETPVIHFSGAHTNYNAVPIMLSAQAFGWNSDLLNESLELGGTNNNLSVTLTPTVAKDEFSSGIGAYWSIEGDKDFVYQTNGENGYISYNTKIVQKGLSASVVSKNYLISDGRKIATLSLYVQNDFSRGEGVSDYAYIEVATNRNFLTDSIVARGIPVSNRIATEQTGAWNKGTTAIKLPDFITASTPLYVNVKGVAGGVSRLSLNVDNLRIAFQDMATVEGLRRTGTEEAPSFEIDVKPWCGEGQSVSNVTVELVMDVGGKVFTVPAAKVDALSTNATFTISAAAVQSGVKAGLGRALRSHETVKYWGQVTYFADSRDPDPTKEMEKRYFPDNAKIDSEGRWTVEGDYGVDMAKVESFTVPGGPITLNSDFERSASDISTVTFGARVYDENGVGPVTVTVAGGGEANQISTYEGNGAAILDIDVAATNLAANTEYTVSISGTNGNGDAIEGATFTFVTLAKPATQAPIVEKVLNTVVVSADDAYTPAADSNPAYTEYAVRVTTSAGGDAIATTNAVEVWQTLADWKAKPVTFGVPAIDLEATNTFRFVARNLERIVAESEEPATTNCVFNMEASFGSVRQVAEPYGNVSFSVVFTDPLQSETASAEFEYFVGDNKVADQTSPITFETLAVTNAYFWDARAIAGEGTHAYRIRARVMSGGRASEWVEVSGEVDFTPPADFDVVGTPAAESVSGNKTFRFAPETDGAEPGVSYHWEINNVSNMWPVVTAPTFDQSMVAERAVCEGRNTVAVWATDAFGNASERVWVSWIVDTTAPTKPVLSGTPDPDVETNRPDFSYTAKADDATALTYCWTLTKAGSTTPLQTGETPPDVPFAGAVDEDGVYTVCVYAKDAAGNVSAVSTWTWTYDTLPPQNLVISGTPSADATVKDPSVNLSAAVDGEAAGVSFAWVLNGRPVPGAGATLTAQAQEGGNAAVVTATDSAGNTTSRTISWTLDTKKPEKLTLDGTPGNGAATNNKAFRFMAEAEDATTLTFCWALTKAGAAAPLKTAETAGGAVFAGAVADDGVYTVSVYAKDAAGNACEAVASTWTLDTVMPTVVLASETPDPFNADDTLAVTVTFSEPVTNFTADSVSVVNGTVGSFSGAEAVYTVTILPETPDEGSVNVAVSVGAGVAADAAGNVNKASNKLAYTCDTKRPTVVLASETPSVFNGQKATVAVTATFSEAVRGFTADAVSVANGEIVGEVVPVDEAANVYRFTVRPLADGAVTVEIAADKVTDAAGNGNERSGVLTRTNDTTAPTKPVLSGTPAGGASVNGRAFSFAAEAEDATALTYFWHVTKADDPVKTGETAHGVPFAGALDEDGVYTVGVYAKDAAGNTSETSTLSWTLDTVRPTVVSLDSATPERFNTAPMAVTVAFSEAVTNFTASSIWVDNGSVDEGSIAEVAGAPHTYTFSVTPVEKEGEDVELAVGIVMNAVADAAGNGNDASATLTRSYDTTPPAVELAGPAAAYVAGAVTVTATFAEEVSGFNADSVTVENGTVGPVTPVEGAANAYRFSVTPAQEGVLTVFVAADVVTDAAGNRNKASNVLSLIYDITPPPTPVLTGIPANGTATREPAFSFVASAEDATELTYCWTLTKAGAASPVQTGETSADGAFSGRLVEDGVYTVTAYAKDAAGNISGNGGRRWTFDTVRPTVTALESETPARFNTAPMTVTLAFSETVTNVTADIVTVENGEVREIAAVVDAANTYTVTVVPDEPAADGDDVVVAVSLAADVVADAAGNGNEASATLTRVYDVTPPTVEISSETPQRFNGSSFTVTLAFSEAVTNVSADIVTVENGEATGVAAVVGSANAYTVTVVPDKTAADGDDVVVAVSLPAGVVADAAGNGNVASATLTRTYDHTAPTATLTSDTRDPFNGNDVFAVKVVFSETVKDFTSSSLTVDGGTVSDDAVVTIEGEDNAYLVTVTATKDGEISVQLAEGAVTDVAGNANEASNSITRRCDITKPTAAFSSIVWDVFTETDLENGCFTVTVQFSEPVDGFDAQALKISGNAEISGIAGSGDRYDVSVRPKADGVIALSIVPEAVMDAAGNGNAASGELTRTYDTMPPSKPVISGTPQHGAVIADVRQIRLTATAEDVSEVLYFWFVNNQMVSGHYQATLTADVIKNLKEGENSVFVVAHDATASQSEPSDTLVWTVKKAEPSGDLAFGESVTLPVDPESGATNRVVFSSVTFRPGEACSFVLTGFEAKTAAISALQMWFVVTDRLGGTPWRVKVDETAAFDPATGELTVSLPADATTKQGDGAYRSFFVLGVDNKE